LVSGSKSVVQAKKLGIKAVGKTEGNMAEPFALKTRYQLFERLMILGVEDRR
jgi:hypothetical protein